MGNLLPGEAVVLWLLRHGSGESKIADFEIHRFVNEQVCRLNISVHDSSGMEEVQRAEEIVGQLDQDLVRNMDILVPQDLVEVGLHDVENQEDVHLRLGLFGKNDIPKFCNKHVAIRHHREVT